MQQPPREAALCPFPAQRPGAGTITQRLVRDRHPEQHVVPQGLAKREVLRGDGDLLPLRGVVALRFAVGGLPAAFQ